jgi:lipoate-protein ligase A
MDRDISFISRAEDARTSSKRFLDPARNDKALDMTEKLFAELDVYHDTPPRSAAMNMAVDEALLECAKIPSIRFYRWHHAALSFGYFGRFADVANYAAQRDLVRRWTGGGIVLHQDDLTYSIVIPPSDAAFSESTMSIYEKVHRALRDALTTTAQHAELVEGRDAALRRPRTAQRAVPTNVCFANPVRADVLVNGQKVAGAAQRRTRMGLLQQGSIQHVDLGNGLAERFASKLSAGCVEKFLDGRVIKRAREIAAQKYETAAWLSRR